MLGIDEEQSGGVRTAQLVEGALFEQRRGDEKSAPSLEESVRRRQRSAEANAGFGNPLVDLDRLRGAVQGGLSGVPEAITRGEVEAPLQGAVRGFQQPEEFRGIDAPIIRNLPDRGLEAGPVSLTPKTIAGGLVDIGTDPLNVVPLPVIDDAARLAGRGLGRALGRGAEEAIDPLRREALQIPRPGDVPTAIAGAAEEPVDKLTRLLKEAEPVRVETEALKSEELAQRAGRMREAFTSGQGEEAFRAARREQAGELPTAAFEPIRPAFTQPEVDALLNRVTRIEPDVFKAANLQEATLALLGDAKLPTKAQLADMERVFGREFVDLIERFSTQPLTVRRATLDALGIPKSVLSAIDLSAPGRQGILDIGRREWWTAWKPMLQAFGSERIAQQIDDVIRGVGFDASSTVAIRAARRRQYGVDLPRPTTRRAGLSDLEEAFQTTIPERIPGIRTVWNQTIGRSNRAYTTYLNKLRADVFDNTAERFTRMADDGRMTPGQLDANLTELGQWMNIVTGRANLSQRVARSDILVGANRVFFSPRLNISRFQALKRGPRAVGAAALDVAGIRSTSQINKEIARDWLSFVGAGAGALGVMHQFGWVDVKLNPTSSDFGKGKAGPLRYDPWGGMQQSVVFTMRLLDAARQRDPQKATDRALRFGRSKLDPSAALIVDIGTGETFLGDEVDLSSETVRREAGDRLIPLGIQDIIEAANEEGLIGAAKASPALVGVGVSSFESLSEEQRSERDRIAASLPEFEAESFDSLAQEVGTNRALELVEGVDGGELGRITDERIADLRRRAKGGDAFAAMLMVSLSSREQLNEAAQGAESPEDYRLRARTILRDARIARETLLDLSGEEPPEPNGPVDQASNEWFGMFERCEIAGRLDSSCLDQEEASFISRHGEELYDKVLDNVYAVTGDVPELEVRRRTLTKELTRTGFFDIQQREWESLAARGLPANFEEHRAQSLPRIVERLPQTADDELLLQRAEQIWRSRDPILQTHEALTQRARVQWAQQHEELAREAIRFGLLSASAVNFGVAAR